MKSALEQMSVILHEVRPFCCICYTFVMPLFETNKRFSCAHSAQLSVIVLQGANAARIDDDIQDFLKSNKSGATVRQETSICMLVQ